MELGIVIVILNNSDLITAQWNRPVGDLGLAGEVEMFKILVCEDACELLDNAESSETILSVQTSADPGQAGGRGGAGHAVGQGLRHPLLRRRGRGGRRG